MKPTHFINVDLAKVYAKPEKTEKQFLFTLAWGDAVELVAQTDTYIEIRLHDFRKQADGSLEPRDRTGYIMIPGLRKAIARNILAPSEQAYVLKVDFVDVQQGDGAVIETPQGKIMLVDGGDNQLFARYLAGRFQGYTRDKRKDIDCILVTHGDADHFKGLIEIFRSESYEQESWRKLYIKPHHVYHNGLVKRAGKYPDKTERADTEMLGQTIKKKSDLYITGLEDDLLSVPETEMNEPFRDWKRALAHYKKLNKNLVIKRLDRETAGAFSFLEEEGLKLQLLGPVTNTIKGKPALKFLRLPPKMAGTKQLKKQGTGVGGGSYSASHTINGHSVVFKLEYGHFSFLFTGDLNEEAEEILTKESATTGILRSHVLKVPHHGSADFSSKFLEAVNPLVSIVSSGDESAAKEYIHPRATLMGALGKHSRTDRPLVFVTELVAFFERVGWAQSSVKAALKSTAKEPDQFYAFKRTAFGIVKVRTDGKRLLVFTHSGQKDMKEAYAFDITDPDMPQRLTDLRMV